MVPNVFPPPPTFFPGRSEANSDMCIYGRTSKDPARGPDRGPSKIVFAWSRRPLPLPISGAPGRRTCLSHKGPLSALFSMHGCPPARPTDGGGFWTRVLSLLAPSLIELRRWGGGRKGTRVRAHVCVCVRERDHCVHIRRQFLLLLPHVPDFVCDVCCASAAALLVVVSPKASSPPLPGDLPSSYTTDAP